MHLINVGCLPRNVDLLLALPNMIPEMAMTHNSTDIRQCDLSNMCALVQVRVYLYRLFICVYVLHTRGCRQLNRPGHA